MRGCVTTHRLLTCLMSVPDTCPRYEDIQRILTDPENFTVTWPGSTIVDTFGEMMLTTDGELQRYYRSRLVTQTFAPAVIRKRLSAAIGIRIDQLISGF